MFTSRDVDVEFSSNPAGAQVSDSISGSLCRTPCTTTLSNERDYHFTFKHPKAGTETRELGRRIAGPFWANFVSGYFFWVGMGIDWLTGYYKVLASTAVHVDFPESGANLDEKDQAADQGEGNETDPADTSPHLTAPLPDSVDQPASPGPKPVDPYAFLPEPTVEERLHLQSRFSPEVLDQTIDNYYGEISDMERRAIRNRLYRILEYQRKNQGRTDLDAAISLDHHLQLP